MEQRRRKTEPELEPSAQEPEPELEPEPEPEPGQDLAWARGGEPPVLNSALLMAQKITENALVCVSCFLSSVLYCVLALPCSNSEALHGPHTRSSSSPRRVPGVLNARRALTQLPQNSLPQ